LLIISGGKLRIKDEKNNQKKNVDAFRKLIKMGKEGRGQGNKERNFSI